MPRHNTVTSPYGGRIDPGVDSSLVAKSFFTDIKNVTKYTDYFGKRPGRTAYGSGIGSVMGYYHFKIGDYNKFMKFTRTKVYTRSSTTWNDITGTALTGSLDNFVDSCTVYDAATGTPYVVFTNGKDNIRKYTGTGNTSDMSAWTSYKARFVRYYRGYLIAFHLTDGGTRFGFRLRCSDTDYPNDTTGTNSKTFNLTQDRNISDIMRAEYFFDYLAIFKTDCVYLMSLSSDTTQLFNFDVVVHNTGLRASRAVATGPGGSLFFLGYDDIYYWSSPNAAPQGLATRKIKKDLFDNTSPRNLERAISVYDTKRGQVRFYVPEGQYLNKVYVLDINDSDDWSWWYEDVSDITAIGTYFANTIVTIDELTGIYSTIDGMTGTQIDDLSGNIIENFPIVIEGDKGGNSRYIDETAYSDNGTSIEGHITTGDDIFKDATGKPFTSDRVMGLRIEAKGLQSSGDRLYLYYSVDDGVTWVEITAGINLSDFSVWTTYISLTDSWGFYEAHCDVMTRKVRFKILNNENTSTFMVRKISPIFEDGDGE